MTASEVLKKWNDLRVPDIGEVVIEQGTNKIKIGDGKTNFANLPYVDDNPPESQLSIGAKAFIEDHIELLENNDYETFYSKIKTIDLAREVSKALFKAGLNPKEHLKECPRGCESIFYYEGGYDPNEDFKETLKQRGWAQLVPPRRNQSWFDSFADLQYNTSEQDSLKTFEDHFKELEDYLTPVWELEDDE